MTGTPLQNKTEDAQALFAFLRVSPVADAAIFNRAISRPIREGDPSALQRLCLLMRAVCLRRTKAQCAAEGAKLPDKTVEVSWFCCKRFSSFIKTLLILNTKRLLLSSNITYLLRPS